MQQEFVYSLNDLQKLISDMDLNQPFFQECQISKIKNRQFSKYANTCLKLQTDEIQEAYQQSYNYQEKIIQVYNWIREIKDIEEVANKIYSQFGVDEQMEDEMIITQSAEKLIQFYQRTDNIDYLKVLSLIIKKYEMFNEYIVQKLRKDIKLKLPKSYSTIRQLYEMNIISEQFYNQVAQETCLQYLFSLKYNFNNEDQLKQQLKQLIGNRQIGKSIWFNNLIQNEQFENKNNQIVQNTIFPSFLELQDEEVQQIYSIIIQTEYQAQRNSDQQLWKEIEYCIQFDKEWYSELILAQILFFRQDLINPTLTLIIQQMINGNNLAQFCINLIQHQDLKNLVIKGIKKTPLMRSIFSQCFESQFKQIIDNNCINLNRINKLAINLSDIGIITRPQLLSFTKLTIQAYLSCYFGDKNVIESKKGFEQLLKIQSNVQMKPHDEKQLTSAIEQMKINKKLNWFDIANLISLESIRIIWEIMHQ